MNATLGFAVAPALAALAVWFAGARVARTRVRDVASAGPALSPKSPSHQAHPAHTHRPSAPRLTPGARVTAAALGIGAAVAVLTNSLLPLLLALPAAAYLRRRRGQAEARREAEALRSGVTDLATVMVGELRAGKPPSEAFATAVQSLDGPLRTRLAEPLAVARIGGDVPEALTRAAAPPGADALTRIAACWRVAAERGAGFAHALDRVAAGLRAEDAGYREVEAELSGARSTARLLAALPAFGLLLGHGIGARPAEVLTHSPVGIGCLLLGLALIAAGLDWTDRIARGGMPWTR